MTLSQSDGVSFDCFVCPFEVNGVEARRRRVCGNQFEHFVNRGNMKSTKLWRKPTARVESPIQQELANVAPDVDAAWRLTHANEPFHFDANRPSVHLAPGAWCPFNSQATWWFPPAFPLMYLPSTCTFRMTDIWRSFVAQRCLWELGRGLTFHAPRVEQERNVHDLMKDFEDEVPGYLKNEQIARTLDALTLRPRADAVADNLVRCYEALVGIGVLKPEELPLVKAWLDDLQP